MHQSSPATLHALKWAECRTIDDSIKLHKNAIEHARKGSKKIAVSALGKSMVNWKKIVGGNQGCTSVEKANAIDGILGTSNDSGVVTNL